MRKTIIKTATKTYESRDYILINPAWLKLLLDIPKEEVGKLLINLCIKYGKQINHNLLEMDWQTEAIFKMMDSDQEVLDCLAQYPCCGIKRFEGTEDD